MYVCNIIGDLSRLERFFILKHILCFFPTSAVSKPSAKCKILKIRLIVDTWHQDT
jgi:hypothetical protein